ncbi:MAG: glutamine synthetase, partial [Gaiellaceae bacterium]|nr:glutamine synthetase [Gaiellaceae bacterium]
LLEGSSLAREALGDEVVEHYLHAAHVEQDQFDRAVTDWELRRSFERL